MSRKRCFHSTKQNGVQLLNDYRVLDALKLGSFLSDCLFAFKLAKNVRGETGCGKTSTISRVIIIIFWSDSPKHDERSRNCNLLSFKILGHNWLWSHSSRFKIVRKRQRLTFFFKAARCLTPAIPVNYFFTPVTLTDQTPNLTDFKTTNTVIDHARNNSQC